MTGRLESLDDLERAVEKLIDQQFAPRNFTSMRDKQERSARARELVRRLRAGIARAEVFLESPEHAERFVADEIMVELTGEAIVTGATGEERE